MKPLLFTLCLMALMVSHTPRAVAAENNPDEILEFLTRFYSDDDFQQEHVQYPLLHIACVVEPGFEDEPYTAWWTSDSFTCIKDMSDSPYEYVQLSDNAIRVQLDMNGFEYYHYFRYINKQWYLFDVYHLNSLTECDYVFLEEDLSEMNLFVQRFYSDQIFRTTHTLFPILTIDPLHFKGFYQNSKEEIIDDNLELGKYYFSISKRSKNFVTVGVYIDDTDIGDIAVFRFIDGQWYYTDTICQ